MRKHRDPRTRILRYFLLGIALPSGIFGYLAIRGIRNDRALVERERRVELEVKARQLATALDGRLDELARFAASATDEELRDAVAREPHLDAAVRVDEAAAVMVFAARGTVFTPDEETEPVGNEAEQAALDAARRRELRADDPVGALGAYRSLAEAASSGRVRADALAGAARVERKLGRHALSAKDYEKLRAEFGSVPSPAGIPYGLAASLELGAVLMEAGDTARAVIELLRLHRDLVSGGWRMTAARWDLLTSTVGDALRRVRQAGLPSDARYRLESLEAEAALARRRALDLTTVADELGRSLLREGSRLDRAVVEPGGSRYAVVLAPAGTEPAATRRGVIVDPAALATEVFAAATGGDTGRLSWVLRSRSGEDAVASVAPDPSSPRVSAALAGIPGWTVELALAPGAAEKAFLSSRRALFLWAFALIAGILVFGVVLTLRAVGRELELAQLKSDFVSTVSHEFKSPLTTIRQLAEMLQAGRVPSEERRRMYHDVLVEQSERLSRLVDNVLNLARLEEGQPMRKEPVDLGTLVQEVVSEASRRAGDKGFTIRVDPERDLPKVPMEADAVRQALSNLIDNGIKYSGTSRRLELRAYRQNGEAVVSVRDFGIGLAPEEADRVFERFYRAGDELTRSVQGTGLGLALVRQIALAHGGSVEVRSAPGQGSTFILRLPFDAVRPADPSDGAGGGR